MIKLHAGEFRLVLDAETGGAIAALTYESVELLRPVADPRLAAQHGRAVAGYPLIPYANRIAHGRFAFGGESFALDLNFAGHPHSIHGNAWMHPWTVREAAERQAHLFFDHVPDAQGAREWPYAYRAEQIFTLSETTLSIELAVRNTDTRPFPAGVGLHPYVAKSPGTRLMFEADTIWSNAADALPCLRSAVEGEQEFDRGREVSATPVDNCYAGWGGRAGISFPGRAFELVIGAGLPFDHFQVYTPEGRDFMGLEPVSNMPDAINRMDAEADHGLRVLGPGETLSGIVSFTIAE